MVQLGVQLETYGVDAVRLTMLFAGPPEDDIDWADVSPSGAVRFLGRVLRLADEVTSPPAAGAATGSAALRRTTHRLLRMITDLIEARRLNVAVARTMELVNAARRAVGDGLGGDPALREAAEAIAVVLSVFVPYTAEEMWSRLGHAPACRLAGDRPGPGRRAHGRLRRAGQRQAARPSRGAQRHRRRRPGGPGAGLPCGRRPAGGPHGRPRAEAGQPHRRCIASAPTTCRSPRKCRLRSS